ncbi:bulb-type lectin domain-containing protein [Tanacetum coccineum]
MATKPNDVSQTILMKQREEFDVEATLEEEMMNLFRHFADRIRLRRPEIFMLGLQPDNPLVDHGREGLERLTGADMRNANNVMLAKNELLRSMTKKEEFIGNYYLVAEEGIAIGCFGDMRTFCNNEKLEKVVAIIKSCTPNALCELTVTLKDPTGTISDTLHHKVLTEGGYESLLHLELF